MRRGSFMTRNGISPFLKLLIAGSFVFGFAERASSTAMLVYDDTTLTANHYDQIVIMSSNVTVNLNGYSVIGNNSTSSGIYMYSKVNVTITSTSGYGRVQGFNNGIYVNGGSNVTVRYINIQSCTRGFKADNASDIYLQNVYANNSAQEGVDLSNISETEFDVVNANYNDRDGFDLGDGSYFAFDDCNGNYNAYNGIEIDRTTWFELNRCYAYNNGQHGISITDNSSHGSIYYSTGSYNGDDGIHLNNTATGLTYYRCNAFDNGQDGINLDNQSSGNSFTKCYMYYNDRDGLHIRDGSTNNTFSQCVGRYSGDDNKDDNVGGNHYYSCSW